MGNDGAFQCEKEFSRSFFDVENERPFQVFFLTFSPDDNVKLGEDEDEKN